MLEKSTLRVVLVTFCTLIFNGAPSLQAANVNVAVASNFKPAMLELVEVFGEVTGNTVVSSFASTGTLYAQIRQGAPFDAFLAADAEHPGQLEIDGLSLPGSRFTYAVGVLVLWYPGSEAIEDGRRVLATSDFRFVAIANPALAPYGRAAQEALQQMGLWEALEPKIIRGQNVGQTFAFVASGNAELGLVALSQVYSAVDDAEGAIWTVPQHLYSTIEQQAVLLKESEGGRSFLDFLARKRAGDIIRRHGYLRD